MLKDTKTENIYAVLFNNGILKVGRSSKPENRIKKHIVEASRHMIDCKVFFISEPVSNANIFEQKLINHCAQTHERNGLEYFLGADFDFAREAMLSLGLLVTWGDEFKKSEFEGMTTISTSLTSGTVSADMLDMHVLKLLKIVIKASKDGVVSRGVFMDRLRKKKKLNNKVLACLDSFTEENGIQVINTKHCRNGKAVIKYKLTD